MKHIILLFLGISLFLSCKTKQKMSDSTSTEPVGKTLGKVSFKYKADGCTSVIVVGEGTEAEMTLIPKDAIDKKMDKDGQEIYFNYRPLKMATPAGCGAGMPAEITDVSVKK